MSKTPYQNLKENQKISFISLINKIKNKPINLNLNQTKIPEKSKIEVIQSFRHSSENAYFKLNKSHRTMIDGRIEPFDSINKNKFKKILLKKNDLNLTKEKIGNLHSSFQINKLLGRENIKNKILELEKIRVSSIKKSDRLIKFKTKIKIKKDSIDSSYSLNTNYLFEKSKSGRNFFHKLSTSDYRTSSKIYNKF